ncbi:MAG: pre-peptidase C-terminal domain-containing protein [Anaerolineae bacterium]|nr:pre-peptidase C-terminal domain-containing protein [Anaerolineae bacterium]
MRKETFKKLVSLLCIVVILTNSLIPGIFRPMPAFAEAPPPVSPTPTAQPPDLTGAGENFSAQAAPTPAPGQLPPKAEVARARQVMETALAKYRDYYGPRLFLELTGLKIEGDWAHAIAVVEDRAGTTALPPELHLLAQRLPGGEWQALLPDGDEVYRQWLADAPEKLISTTEKAQLQQQADIIAAQRPAPATPDVPPPVPGKVNPPAIFSQAGPTPTPTPVFGWVDVLTDTQIASAASYTVYLPMVVFNASIPELKQPEMLPGTIEVEPAVENITRLALIQASDALPIVEYYAITGLQEMDKWSFVSVAGLVGIEADLSWNLLDNGIWFGLVLLHRDNNGNWEGAVEGTEKFSTLLSDIPDQILDGRTKQELDPLQRQLQAADSTYRFPWPTGTSMRYGSNGVHNNGFSGVVSDWKAVDFLSDGDTGAGHAPNTLLAAASGSISYVCNDGTSVAIKIGDLFYTHLLNNGNLHSGYYFSQGDILGQMKSGDFSNTCGYATQGAGWFHVHWGFPNAESFQVENWSLNLSDELWRRGEETRDIGSWFKAGEGEGSSCSAPSLIEPPDGVTLNNRTVTFRWNAVSGCTFNGYTFRVCTSSNVDNLSNCFIDTGEGGTQRTETINGHDNQDLWWGVKAANAPNGANWAVRRFRINPDSGPPSPDHSVQFYKDANYGGGGYCYGDNEGNYNNLDGCSGYNDQISSVLLKSGWSVRVFKHANLGEPSKCFTSSDDDFANDTFDDGSRLNDEMSSFALYHQSSCPPLVNPPSAPALQSPANGASFNEGESITLAWSATGNEYYGEIWGGPGGTLTFGWQSGTSKNIGSQWPGYTYSWRVKARNSAGESGWSSTWTFTVKPAAPSGLNAQAVSCSQVNLYWNDTGNEDAYRIYRNGAYLAQVGANVTNYQNTGLSGDTGYSYYVKAYKGSIESNASNTVNITTPSCVPSLPDLRPYTRPGYTYPVVPSSVTGTHTPNTLYAGQPTYFDWYFVNSGTATAPGGFYFDLWVDSTRYVHYSQPNYSPGQYGGFDDWMEVISTPGWHTVRLVADPENTVAESDETNNTWEHQFYWTPSAPYFDNMENGLNGWTTTGLWHQVNSSSPYYAAYSGSHSWWYGQDDTGDYDTGAANSGDLTSPIVYIPSAGYYLRFWYAYETESMWTSWDQRWVQISMDGGPFENVLQLYDDPMNWWLQSRVIDLSGYAGHTIQVRFHFDTIDDGYNTYRGWYLDDFSITTTPPPTCADSYEPNNTPTQATTLSYGQSRNANICAGGDYDFYKFTGSTGDKVVVDIDAKVNGSALDSYIFLLDSDGTTVLAANDDEVLGEVQDSQLGYQLPRDDTYYIKVRAWDHPSAGSSDHFYTINLSTDTTNPASAQITLPASDGWLDPTTQTVTALATDNESGVNRVEFLWHDADWENSEWTWLGADYDSRDGWSWDFDTSGLAEQQGGAFYIWAFDWAGNWTGAAVWNLGIDRTPPTVSVSTGPMYGDAPFVDFHLWWSGTDNLSGMADYDVQYRDGAAGTWTNLLTTTTDTYTSFVGQDGHTYYFRARARDVVGNQSVYASGDGDAQYTVQTSPVAPDAYEADNSKISASTIPTDGTWQPHNFHTDGDQDWLKFTATAGVTYTLVTTNTGGHADTIIYLYGNDGVTLIASNDDDPNNWPASRLEWGATGEGIYYIRVEHWDPYAYGSTTAYEVSVAETGSFEMATKVFLPIIIK